MAAAEPPADPFAAAAARLPPGASLTVSAVLTPGQSLRVPLAGLQEIYILRPWTAEFIINVDGARLARFDSEDFDVLDGPKTRRLLLSEFVIGDSRLQDLAGATLAVVGVGNSEPLVELVAEVRGGAATPAAGSNPAPPRPPVRFVMPQVSRNVDNGAGPWRLHDLTPGVQGVHVTSSRLQQPQTAVMTLLSGGVPVSACTFDYGHDDYGRWLAWLATKSLAPPLQVQISCPWKFNVSLVEWLPVEV